ncbi:MAG: nucleoside triphosphate pyrophosphohydrolase [Myxococcales bacterium]|nr:nucleoside triphosphate pyrophosphohydrolase [Myxococcales bacterium]
MEALDRLLDVMAKLRHPETGCPWDVEQTFETVAPYTLEEAYEVDDAIQRGDRAGLRDELGDLLFQVVFHARMAEEEGAFDFADVARSICEKMESRHPHVFGDAVVADAAEQTSRWEEHKERERRARGDTEPRGVLEGVTLGLPALLRAQKLGRRAARAGFDWAHVRDVLGKLREELGELEVEVAAEASHEPGAVARIEEELGDLLFVATGVAERFGLSAEKALRGANAKFERRIGVMEAILRDEGREAPGDDDAAWLQLWARAKKEVG